MDKLTRRVAEFCCVEPSEIDEDVLNRAIQAVDENTILFHDALADCGQMPDNVPRTSAIAIVYDWLTADCAG